jgi:hypothetical protein
MRTGCRCLIVAFVLLASLDAPANEAEPMLGAGAGLSQPPGARGETGVEAEQETNARPCLTVIITWAPIGVLVVVWIWFVRHHAKTLRRSRQHMDELERLTNEILEALGRIEQTLNRR